ncbi:aminotransferase class V-fold PLP-dependent enzyme (plasmid) [Embleya sp. NBC_00888]|uniref:aminotransferase class V-fold PLP-dependent enzyme n=1 Tax=Embleya sp. NBC_00888 TaxID=2975960 RepID=UPI002F917CEC|nr:aminotransferase class V-fold PLP-dependent enzyme [Embleya sp. NBC_00888]
MTLTPQDSEPFGPETMQYVRQQFAHLEQDAHGARRLFFENSGGSLRLRQAAKRSMEVSLYPEAPSRPSKVAQALDQVEKQGQADLLAFFGAGTSGAILPTATASRAMFDLIRTVAENVPGTNIVTTAIEHPSSYDACEQYARRTEQQLRVAQPNRTTGGVDASAIAELVDTGTSLVSVIATSNITGAVIDVPAVVEAVRAKNPDVYIVVDAVQYAPHGIIDAQAWEIDGVNIAPYKMFGDRGNAFTYLSPRLAELTHDKLTGANPDSWSLGSSAPAAFAGFTAIMDYLAAVGGTAPGTERRQSIVAGIRAVQRHEQAILRTLLDGTEGQTGLRDMAGVQVHFADASSDHPRDLIVPLTFDALSCANAVRAYEDNGVIVYERVANNHYSARILRSLGLEGVVRVSPLHCHTPQEAEHFLHVTERIAK